MLISKRTKMPFLCSQRPDNVGGRRQIAHKNLDFVLETPENGGFGRQKRTKTLILCSKRPKMRVPKAKSAQKPRFCARNSRKRGFQTPKAHKNPDFVLETPENEGFETQKRTKIPFLCSEGLKLWFDAAMQERRHRFAGTGM